MAYRAPVAPHLLTDVTGGIFIAGWGAFVLVWVIGAIYNSHAHLEVRRRVSFLGPWTFGVLLLAGISLIVPHHIWQAFTVSSPVFEVAGAVVMVPTTALTLWARITLGTMWSSSPTLKTEHVLRTDGPYAWTRHPIYSGLLAMILASGLASGGGEWLLVALATLVFVLARVHAEEGLMSGEFGAEYEAYRARVPRLVPALHPRRRAKPSAP